MILNYYLWASKTITKLEKNPLFKPVEPLAVSSFSTSDVARMVGCHRYHFSADYSRYQTTPVGVDIPDDNSCGVAISVCFDAPETTAITKVAIVHPAYANRVSGSII